ncbi:integrase [Burkholderia sp. 4M9327F10]|uniref:integrase n=1 Tax=Burkholderia sp. 4M9327F10 TaxID=2502223 RepID=UPI0010F999B6|nr:integrase [Burkholderia sp. 4M9327F10]
MSRQYDEVRMPLAEGTTLLHPERALLKWEGINNRSDIGQICYLTRDTSSPQRTRRTFDHTSFSSERTKVVRLLMTQLSERITLGAMRPNTIYIALRVVLDFVNWADRQGLHQVLCDEQATAEAVHDYFREKREQVALGNLNRNSVGHNQRNLLSTLREFFRNDDFCADVRVLRHQQHASVPTAVPDAEAQAALLAWADALFSSISTLVLDFKPYPVRVTTARGESLCLVPHTHDRSEGDDSHGLLGWNLETGQPRAREELTTRMAGAKNPRQRSWAIARLTAKHLAAANEDTQSPIRRSHASMAALCFAALFLAETGVNLAQLLAMKWSPELAASLQVASAVRQKFREIKYRSGGRDVTFTVSLGFMPKLKAYLALREYLVQDADCDTLFIVVGHYAQLRRLMDLPSQFLARLYDRLDTLGIVLPRISAREWRAAKQDWAVSNHGPVVAAKLMGHSLDTALRSYSNGTDAAHKAEMGAFLASVEKTVLKPGNDPAGSIKSAVGVCIEFHKPAPIAASVTVQPDCRSTEGCLFCDQYRVHADAADIRKLLSCRHCVRLVSGRADSIKQYDRSFGAVLRRVDFLLDELRKRDATLVYQIEQEVDINGNLDAFWSAKLDQLYELGVA